MASVSSRIVSRLCPPVAGGASALVVLAGECDEDASQDLARSVAAAGASELLLMLGAAREAFPDEEVSKGGLSTLYVTAILIDADGAASDSSGTGETLVDALVPLKNTLNALPAHQRRGPFSSGGGGRPLSGDTPPSSPSVSSSSNSSSLTLRDDVAAGGIVARGNRVAACFTVSDVASLLASLPRTTPGGTRSHSLVTVSISPHEDAPRLTILRLARASGSSKGVPQWVSATARVLAAIESRSPHIPFAASRVSLIMRDALNGRVDCVFVAALPYGPPAIVTASLHFAARVRAAADTLSAGNQLSTQPQRSVEKSLSHSEERGEQSQNHVRLPSSPTTDIMVAASIAANEELAASSRALFSSTLSALEHSRSECIALQERVAALAVAAAATAVAAPTLSAARGGGLDLRNKIKTASVLRPTTLATTRPTFTTTSTFTTMPKLATTSSTIATTTSATVNTLSPASEAAFLHAKIASLQASNKSLASTSRDFSLYREVVEASVARLQSDVATLAAARDEALAACDQVKVILSKERRTLGAAKRRATELEAHVAALEVAAAGKVEATASVAAMRTALREARAAGAGSEAAAAAARDAALSDAENLRNRYRALESAFDAAQHEVATLRAEANALARAKAASAPDEFGSPALFAFESAASAPPTFASSTDAAAGRPPLPRSTIGSKSQKVRSVLVSPPPQSQTPSSDFPIDFLDSTRPPPIEVPLEVPLQRTIFVAAPRIAQRTKLITPKAFREEEASATDALASALRALQRQDPRLGDLGEL